ncbi:Arginine transport system permease protein ArtQ [Dickeya dianthicola]|uniref:Amino acid ABC transporter permease n=1 Tax=Dickeya dianthicola TaxID=204039 RepID=A0AAP2D2W0_9GAMM|nr:amino acid ABC transporter permease [Dickeya dianthicola]ATO34866.1 Glutamate Aspartate transport system permeas protein GltJ [Dickeya dianthicola RNS04.9]AYC20695.1 Arginine transport system permease protein ArtQ [Dickeya dianthicola]MBI0439680.1 amino acid ABC transporter permease [Dickeya dianthicola]MBI0450184.1 amino acid ABC transporter permease [Dickeya dianthicola]MBI0454733.1 amino acid ABC transporter permease [Dickeya dianthicola]
MALDFSSVMTDHFGQMIIDGTVVTLELALGAWLLAMFIALALVVVRLSNKRTAQLLVAAYVSYHRNVPTLIQLMMWYFAIPTVLPESLQMWINGFNAEFLFSLVALGVCQAAYFSEDIRSGLRAIPHGQNEAARALGMSYMRAMWLVSLPQGIRNALPSIINHSVLLFKNTSLAMVIGVAELTYVTRNIENQTFRTFEAYVVTTAGYLAFSLVLMGVGALLARRFQRVYAR